jgi:hypothetical protein
MIRRAVAVVRGLVLLLLASAVLGSTAQAGLFGKDQANDGKERDAYTHAELTELTTRVEAVVTLDGKPGTYKFRTLYNCIAWLFTQDAKGHQLAWPPVVRMQDMGSGDKATMVELPFAALTPDQEKGLILTAMPGDPRKSFGPWIITTDFKLLTTDFPNALLYTDLEAAAHQAANWHGAVYSWDDYVLKLAETYRKLSLSSGGGGTQTYRIEVTPDGTPLNPAIIPGGDEEMK